MFYNYVNMDKNLIRVGGRKAIAINKDDFLKKLFKIHSKYSNIDINDFTEKDLDYECIVNQLSIENDLNKVSFNDENNYTNGYSTPIIDETVPNLLGIHTLSNGFTFLGCMAGGDGEYPLFFIIYWDGKKLRGYIPQYGNCYNLDFKSAFGSEGEYRMVDSTKVLMLSKYNDVDKIGITDCYIKANNIDIANNNIVVNWKAVQEDIENRIKL